MPPRGPLVNSIFAEFPTSPSCRSWFENDWANACVATLPYKIFFEGRIGGIPLALGINREVLIFEVFRNALRLFQLDLFRCGVKRVVGFPTFCRAAHVGSGVSKRDARFRESDKFHRLLRGDGQR